MLSTILLAHLVGDYLLQTKWMFSNKSAFNRALFAHTFVYALTLFSFLHGFILITGNLYGYILQFVAINAVAHFLVDGFFSKVTKVYLKRFDYGSFFVVLGVDQTIHILTLVNTL